MAESHDLSERVNLYTDGKISGDSVSMKYKPQGESRGASTEIAFKFCRREDSESLVMMQMIEMRLKPIDVASRSTSHNRGMKTLKTWKTLKTFAHKSIVQVACIYSRTTCFIKC